MILTFYEFGITYKGSFDKYWLVTSWKLTGT